MIFYCSNHLNLLSLIFLLLIQSFDLPYMEEEVPPQRGKKRSIVEISGDNDLGAIYKFKILLPNGTSLGLNLHEHKLSNLLMPLQEFIGLVRTEYFRTRRQPESPGTRQKIMWKSKDIFLVDASENRMKHTVNFRKFEPHKCHILQLNVSFCISFHCTCCLD